MIKHRLKRHIVNTAIFVNVLILSFKKNSKNKLIKNTAAFITVGNQYIYLGILSAISFKKFVKNVKIIFVNDGSLTKFHKKLIKLMGSEFELLEKLNSQTLTLLKKHSIAEEMYQKTWAGKKLFTPILSQYKKIIVIDADCLFFSSPKKIIDWVNDKDAKNLFSLYLQDYLNFKVISPIEAQKYLKMKNLPQQLNSGLLCINRESVNPQRTLKNLNHWLENIGNTLCERIIRDYYRGVEFLYQIHLVEQTVYCLYLSQKKPKALDKSYSLLKTKNEKITFIHFTPDSSTKDIEYGYLFLSLKKSILKLNFNQNWYKFYKITDFISVLKKSGFRKKEVFFLSAYKVLIND
jgi:hypothetical protein